MSQGATRRQALEVHAQSRCAAQRLAEWEQRTDESMKKSQCFRDATLLGMKYEHELKLRRQQINDLHESELQQWKNLVKTVQAVSRDKQLEQIKERAYRLKEKRETERREFVKECNERRWRDGSDEIRAQESLAMAHQTIKNALEEAGGGEKKICVLNKVEQLNQIEQGEGNQHESFRQKQTDIRRALDFQVNFNKCQREIDKKIRCKEEEESRQRIASLEIDEYNKLWDAKRKMLQLGAEMRETSAKRQVERKMARDLESQKDKALLNYQLDKENKEVEEEKLKKECEKLISMEFIGDLKKEDMSTIDLMQNEYTEKIWRKRDEDVKSQEEARYRLNKDIQQVLQMQIEEQKKRTEVELKASENEARVNGNYLEEQAERERKTHTEVKIRKLTNMEENKALIELRGLAKWRKEQQNYLQHKEMRYEENLYQQHLKEYKSSY